jgi:hypothetical protein
MSAPAMQRDRKIGKAFRPVHVIWALIGVFFSALLIFGGSGGHPPAIIFLPFVLAIWCLGHAVLWIVSKLEAEGRKSVEKTEGEVGSWPPELMLLLIGSGLVSCAGIVFLVGSLFAGGWLPFPDNLWAFTVMFILAHGVCFVALLLRRSWSRYLGALLCGGWILLVVWQLSEQLRHGHRIDLVEYGILFAGIVLPSFLAYRILSSPRVKAFLAR